MLLGITENLQESTRLDVKKHIGLATVSTLIAFLIPFVLYALFYFNVAHSKSTFSADIQEPVAKVVTGTGIGSAFLVNPTTLLTARHVVAKNKVGDQVDLYFEHSKNQTHIKATVRYIAPATEQADDEGGVKADYFLSDVAVLEVSAIDDIEPLVLGESDAVQNLDEVILIGYPGGDYSITKGNINSDKFSGLNLFKLDATANPGNSGGPCILKADNTVIGILVGNRTTAQQGDNISLKINDVKKILRVAKINF